MKSDSKAIKAILAADSGISQLVGTRIYPLRIPATVKQFPYIVYKLSEKPSEGTKDGRERIVSAQITVVAKGYEDAHAVADLIEGAFYDEEATLNQSGLYDPEFAGEEEDAIDVLDVNCIMVLNIINFTKYVD